MSTSHTHTHTLTQVYLLVCAQNFVECTNLPSHLYRSGTITSEIVCAIPLHGPLYNENTKTHTHTKQQQIKACKETNKQIINCQRTAPAEGYNEKLSPIYACSHSLSSALSHSLSSLFVASAARRLTTDWLLLIPTHTSALALTVLSTATAINRGNACESSYGSLSNGKALPAGSSAHARGLARTHTHTQLYS